MYVLFAIMILITSDEFDNEEKEKPTLKEILSRSKSIVKLDDFVDAYRAIYQSIPAFHSTDDLDKLSNNKLFLEMIMTNAKKEQNED